jgi:Holliday junction resolvasome RuvABC endonuclease subunit
MPQNQLTILAIAPSARELGIAVLSGESLLFYGVKTVRARRGSGSLIDNVRQCVSQLVTEYQPDYVALANPVAAEQQASSIRDVYEEILQIIEEKKRSCRKYQMPVVRRRLCTQGKSSKREIAILLAARFPELERYLYVQNLWQYLYYSRIFDAIAIAIVCLQDINLEDEIPIK